jgi:hypothetical protein
MKAEIPLTNVKHKVGACPACRDYLWADVAISVSVGEPTLSTDGKALVYASAKPVAMSVQHECRAEDAGAAR